MFDLKIDKTRIIIGVLILLLSIGYLTLVLTLDLSMWDKFICSSIGLAPCFVLLVVIFKGNRSSTNSEKTVFAEIDSKEIIEKSISAPERRSIDSRLPEKWIDRTNRIVKVPMQLAGLYHKDSDRWSDLHIEVEYKRVRLRFGVSPVNPSFFVERIEKNDPGAYLELDPLPGEFRHDRIALHFYKDSWFVAEGNIRKADVHTLIDASELYEAEKLERDIQRAEVKIHNNQNNPSRERIPEEVQVYVWNRDGGKCVRCGEQELLEYDHIIPVSKGGSNTARNIQLLCQKCNREKGANIGR